MQRASWEAGSSVGDGFCAVVRVSEQKLFIRCCNLPHRSLAIGAV